MTTGETIKFYRKEKNLTQGQLAELIGVSTQAVSKWETDAGMPDISQIVPLAKVLEVSTDKLLGYTDAVYDKELKEIRKVIDDRLNFVDKTEEAWELYRLTSGFFDKYPDVPDVALACLESYIELYFRKEIEATKEVFLENCDRYSNSVFRYETNSDNICKTYYLAARAYDLCGENSKAEEYMKKLPYIYGDREYWEAEIAFADKRYEEAMDGIKKSFASKARFLTRCIRLAARIHYEQADGAGVKNALELNEYMLRLLDALLSGGEYMPHRQAFQKASLLTGLIYDCATLGQMDKAYAYFQELYDMRDKYLEFIKDAKNKHCLMFVEGDTDGLPDSLEEYINGRIEKAGRIIKQAEATK